MSPQGLALSRGSARGLAQQAQRSIRPALLLCTLLSQQRLLLRIQARRALLQRRRLQLLLRCWQALQGCWWRRTGTALLLWPSKLQRML